MSQTTSNAMHTTPRLIIYDSPLTALHTVPPCSSRSIISRLRTLELEGSVRSHSRERAEKKDKYRYRIYETDRLTSSSVICISQSILRSFVHGSIVFSYRSMNILFVLLLLYELNVSLSLCILGVMQPHTQETVWQYARFQS